MIAEDDLGEDDKDVEGNNDLMDNDEEIAVDILEELTFGLDDNILPYKSD